MGSDYDRQVEEFAQGWEAVLDNEDHPDYDLACTISNWLTWVWLKPGELIELDEELALVKFAAWRELLDLHLWGGMEPLQKALEALPADQSSGYLDFFERCQAYSRERLTQHGYERLAPQPGALLIPGEATPIPGAIAVTDRAELDGRVCSVAPGKAGYRKDGKILAPAEVVVYRYETGD